MPWPNTGRIVHRECGSKYQSLLGVMTEKEGAKYTKRYFDYVAAFLTAIVRDRLVAKPDA
jgi:hypothetical protein